MKSLTRVASHSDGWYSSDPIELSKELNKYLSKSEKYSESSSLKSIIVPHSGLCFGGPVALEIIGELNSKKFDEYMRRTNNTICGSNPIMIVLSIIEEYKKKHQDKKIKFETAGYAQSGKIKNILYDSAVSYAAGVNFIL